MSTTSLDEAPAPAADAMPAPAEGAPAALALEAAPAAAAPEAPAAAPAPVDPPVKTFRGRTLEELLPQIREQLGPDAVVVRQREGLMGGIGGFFQQRFVEVDAMAGAARPRLDVYDEEPVSPESFAALLAEAEDDAEPIVTAAAFAPPVANDPDPVSQDDSRSGSFGADPAGSGALHAAGLSAAFAERLLADARAHELPFTQGDERAAVRRTLARRLPAALPHRAGGLAVAFAGPGSTAAADALATAYVRAGRRAHAVATVDQARTRLERGAPDALVALDLPPLPHDADEIAQLADRLTAVELDETLLVIPADAGAEELRALHERVAALQPTGLALDCRDAGSVGAALELACATRLPIAYVLDADPAAGARIAPADPAALAERLLP